jgi:DNA-binding transcriptional LysR family regulator
VIDRLVRCQFDLGLVEGEVRHPDLVSEPWLDDRLVVFCAPGHALAKNARATPALLARQRWILRESGSGTRAVLDRALGPLAGKIDVVLTLEHTEAIKRAVEAGLGIACLSRLSVRAAFARGSLIEIETPQLDLSRRFLFAWHRQRHNSAAMLAFVALARELAGAARNTDELVLPHFD